MWSVVHELAHVWDGYNNELLWKKLVIYTDGGFGPTLDCDSDNRKPGCNHWLYHYGGKPPKGSDYAFDPREDFAESLTAYVFPVWAQGEIEKYNNPNSEYYEYFYYSDYTKTLRWKFINRLITEGY